MAIQDGTFTFKSNLNMKFSAPIDNRTLVEYVSDLTNIDTWNDRFPYKGMIVIVQETGDLYVLLNKNDISNIASWKKLGSGSGSTSGNIEWIEWD